MNRQSIVTERNGPYTDYEAWHWRTGHKVGRTIYAMQDRDGQASTNEDVLIGVMDTQVIAAEAVRQHNLDLDIRNSR